MINCGSACLACDYPIHIDTYRGCSHGCKYCFANDKKDVRVIKPERCDGSLRNFVNGKRSLTTIPFDWQIPLHWGGNSDPFQPCEKEFKESLRVLKVFKESQYPFIVSTKGWLAVTEPYLTLLSECNCVVQISMACPEHDKVEPYAPSYEKRLEMVRILSEKVKRVIIRVQPFFIDEYKSILEQIPRYAEAGAYGAIFEGYYSPKKRQGMEQIGGSYYYPMRRLMSCYKLYKEACHNVGLKFYVGEAWLRWFGDTLTCCGTDGMEDFIPSKYNAVHLANDEIKPEASEAMKKVGSAYAFKARNQMSSYEDVVRKHSYAEMVDYESKDIIKWYKEIKKQYQK